VELLNNSGDPVTDVLVFLSRVSYKVQRWWDQEPEYRAMIGVLPPGRWAISVPQSGGAIADVKLGGSPALSRVMVIISFTDHAGNHWARGARGELRQLPAPAIDYWKVHKEDMTGRCRPAWTEQRRPALVRWCMDAESVGERRAVSATPRG
jgi:hypothetical protein